MGPFVLLDRLRYQVNVPRVTTMGPCPTCGQASRGCGECAECLIAQLPDALRSLACDWVAAQREANRAWWALEEAA